MYWYWMISYRIPARIWYKTIKNGLQTNMWFWFILWLPIKNYCLLRFSNSSLSCAFLWFCNLHFPVSYNCIWLWKCHGSFLLAGIDQICSGMKVVIIMSILASILWFYCGVKSQSARAWSISKVKILEGSQTLVGTFVMWFLDTNTVAFILSGILRGLSKARVDINTWG